MSDFQRSASEQGSAFEKAVEFLLLAEGWTINDRHASIEGAEVDIVATDNAGTTWWIECKGSWRGSVPGAKRGDTVKKAVAVAWYFSTLENRCPYMLITSHLPNDGTLGERMFRAAIDAGLFSRIATVGLSPPDSIEADL